MNANSPTRNISIFGDVWGTLRSCFVEVVMEAVETLCPLADPPDSIIKTYFDETYRRVKFSERNLFGAINEFDSLHALRIKCADETLGYVGYRWNLSSAAGHGLHCSIVDSTHEPLSDWIGFSQLLDRRLGSPYTAVYRIPCAYAPPAYHLGYFAGKLATLGTQPQDSKDLMERLEQWGREFWDKGAHLRSGPLRDIYPFNIINNSQVNFAPQGESLEAAIQRLGAGKLTRLKEDRFAWEIDESDLPRVRQPLIDGGFTIYP